MSAGVWLLVVSLIAFVVILVRRPAGSGSSAAVEKTTQPPRPSPTRMRPKIQADSSGDTISVSFTLDLDDDFDYDEHWELDDFLSEEDRLEQSRVCWQGPGQPVQVNGRMIPNGMLYVGSEMVGARSYGGRPAACLIDPDLDTSATVANRVEALDYHPSFAGMQPSQRATYLDWLAQGARDPKVDIGFVFLYFYGLERRALFDAVHDSRAAAEVPAIVREVARLLTIYGDDRSFGHYATGFHNFVCLRDGYNPDRPAADHPADGIDPLAWVDRANELPLLVRAGLGRKSMAQEPLPASWALAYFLGHPASRLRTAGTRCADEFRQLFDLRYEEHFGPGLKIKPNKTLLKPEYRPASRDLGWEETFELEPPLPDLERLTAPVNRLGKLAVSVQDELDSYSRWVGRHDDRDSLAAIACLPRVLRQLRLTALEYKDLAKPIRTAASGADAALVESSELASLLGKSATAKLSKAQARQATAIAEGLGIGIEPDPRYGGANPCSSKRMAVFALGDSPSEPAEDLSEVRLLLRLAVSVAVADGDFSATERSIVDQRVLQQVKTSSDRARLQAFSLWLSSKRRGLRGIRAAIEPLPRVERERIARLLLTVAAADGRLAAEELEMLEKIYPQLGLEATDLHKDIHRAASGRAPEAHQRGLGAKAPTKVMSATRSEGYRVPSRPGESPIGKPSLDSEPSDQDGTDDSGLSLDPEKIKLIREDSVRAAKQLAAVFDQDAEEEPGDVDTVEEGEEQQSIQSSEGVDAEGGDSERRPCELAEAFRLSKAEERFFSTLIAREQWNQAEVDRLASEFGLMASGVIEIINERSFEICGEPLIESGESVVIDQITLAEVRQ